MKTDCSCIGMKLGLRRYVGLAHRLAQSAEWELASMKFIWCFQWRGQNSHCICMQGAEHILCMICGVHASAIVFDICGWVRITTHGCDTLCW